MTTVAIVYHSGYGHTAVLADKVAEGVRDAGQTPVLLKIENAAQDFAPLIEQITQADAVVFGAPTYMGDVSGVFKVFADATASAFFTGAWKDKLAAGFTNSHSFAGDKGHALESLTILAAQHGMNWINLGLGDLLDQRREVLGGALDLQQHRGLAGVTHAFGDLVGQDGGVAVAGVINDGDLGHCREP